MKSILNENEKQKLLENFQSSGKTQAAFAVENGINPKTLARWIYQSRLQEKQTKDSIEFVELKRAVITQNRVYAAQKELHVLRQWRRCQKQLLDSYHD